MLLWLGSSFWKAVAVCLLCCCVPLWLLVCQWVGRGGCLPAGGSGVASGLFVRTWLVSCWEVGIRLAVCVLCGPLLPQCSPLIHKRFQASDFRRRAATSTGGIGPEGRWFKYRYSCPSASAHVAWLGLCNPCPLNMLLIHSLC